MMRALLAALALVLTVAAPAARAQDSDSLTWARANSCERIRDYIGRFPNGRYLAQARAQLTARNCPAPQTSAPADPCVQARADWREVHGSTNLTLLRRYRDGLPAACDLQRAQADARIADLQAQTPRTAPPATPRQAANSPARRPGQEFDDCNGAGWCPRMIVIPAGEFLMGSPENEAGRTADEGPQRRVTIRQFAVGKYEVTFDQWAECVSRGGCASNSNPPDEGWGRGTRPVIHVTGYQIEEYVRWLRGATGQPYRLLTEAEWEYAARAGTSAPYYWGGDPNAACLHANIYDRTASNGGAITCSDGFGLQTAPVGRFRPNAFGLYDMLGNVSEFVQDCFTQSYSGLPADGSANETASCWQYREWKVERGGSFRPGIATIPRSADRDWEPMNSLGADSRGFRIARAL